MQRPGKLGAGEGKGWASLLANGRLWAGQGGPGTETKQGRLVCHTGMLVSVLVWYRHINMLIAVFPFFFHGKCSVGKLWNQRGSAEMPQCRHYIKERRNKGKQGSEFTKWLSILLSQHRPLPSTWWRRTQTAYVWCSWQHLSQSLKSVRWKEYVVSEMRLWNSSRGFQQMWISKCELVLSLQLFKAPLCRPQDWDVNWGGPAIELT